MRSSPTASLNILIHRAIFDADFTGVQAVSNTIRPLSDLTRHLPAFYSVIEKSLKVSLKVF
jgi:hypothetical protein